MRWEKAPNGSPSAVTCFTPRIVDVLIESGLAGNHFGLYHGFGRKIELGLLSNVDIGRALPYMDLGGHSGERPWRLAGQTRAGGARASSLGEAKRSPRVEGPRMSVLKGRNKDAVLASVPSGPISEAPVAWGGALLAPGYSPIALSAHHTAEVEPWLRPCAVEAQPIGSKDWFGTCGLSQTQSGQPQG